MKDLRVAWNGFIDSLIQVEEAWEGFRKAMDQRHGSVAGLGAEEARLIGAPFWRSPLRQMIERFIVFHRVKRFEDLKVQIPERKEEKEAKDVKKTVTVRK